MKNKKAEDKESNCRTEYKKEYRKFLSSRSKIAELSLRNSWTSKRSLFAINYYPFLVSSRTHVLRHCERDNGVQKNRLFFKSIECQITCRLYAEGSTKENYKER